MATTEEAIAEIGVELLPKGIDFKIRKWRSRYFY